MECQVCKTRLEEDDLFCRTCGTKRNVDVTKSQCLNCGHFLKETDLFCSKCGQSVRSKCLACGAILQPNQRFCTKCGEQTCPTVKRKCDLCGNIIDDVTVVFCSQCGASVAAGPSLQKSTEYLCSKVYVQPDDLHGTIDAKIDILEITSTNPQCESISDVTQSTDNVHGTKNGYLVVGSAASQSESCEEPLKESSHHASLKTEEKIKLLLGSFNSDHESSDKIPTQCTDEQREAFRFNKAADTISSEHVTITIPVKATDARSLAEPATTTIPNKAIDVDVLPESRSIIVSDKVTDVEFVREPTTIIVSTEAADDEVGIEPTTIIVPPEAADVEVVTEPTTVIVPTEATDEEVGTKPTIKFVPTEGSDVEVVTEPTTIIVPTEATDDDIGTKTTIIFVPTEGTDVEVATEPTTIIVPTEGTDVEVATEPTTIIIPTEGTDVEVATEPTTIIASPEATDVEVVTEPTTVIVPTEATDDEGGTKPTIIFVPTEATDVEVATEPTTIIVPTEGTDVEVATEPTTIIVPTEGTDVEVATEQTTIIVPTEGTDVEVATEQTTIIVTTEGTDVEVVTEPTTINVPTEGTDVEVATEPTTIIVPTEGTDVEVATEPTTIIVPTEGTDVEVATEPTTIIIPTEGTDVEVATEPTTVIVPPEATDVEVVTEPTTVIVTTEATDDEVGTKPTIIFVPTETTDVEVATEPTTIIVPTEGTDVEVATEPTTIIVPTEGTDVEVATEPTTVIVPTEGTDVEVATETTTIIVPTEGTDVEVATEPTTIIVPTEGTDVEVATEPTTIILPTEGTDVEVVTEPTTIIVPTEATDEDIGTKTTIIFVPIEGTDVEVATEPTTIIVPTEINDVEILTETNSTTASEQSTGIDIVANPTTTELRNAYDEVTIESIYLTSPCKITNDEHSTQSPNTTDTGSAATDKVQIVSATSTACGKETADEILKDSTKPTALNKATSIDVSIGSRDKEARNDTESTITTIHVNATNDETSTGSTNTKSGNNTESSKTTAQDSAANDDIFTQPTGKEDERDLQPSNTTAYGNVACGEILTDRKDKKVENYAKSTLTSAHYNNPDDSLIEPVNATTNAGRVDDHENTIESTNTHISSNMGNDQTLSDSSSVATISKTSDDDSSKASINTTATELRTFQEQDHLVETHVALLESGPLLVKSDDILCINGPQYTDTLSAQGIETENTQNRTPSTEESTCRLGETVNADVITSSTKDKDDYDDNKSSDSDADSKYLGDNLSEKSDLSVQDLARRKQPPKKSKNKPNARQRKKKQKKATQAQDQKSSRQTSIVFHVILSEQFKSLQPGDHVFMHWKEEKETASPNIIKLTSSDLENEAGKLYTAVVDIHVFPSNLKFVYYYGVMRGKEEEKEKMYPKDKTNRTGDFCRKSRLQHSNKDTIHVYDGVAYPHGMETFGDKLRKTVRLNSSKDVFERDMVDAPALFLPQQPEIRRDLFECEAASARNLAEGYLKSIQIVLDELKSPQDAVQKCILKYLITPLLQTVNSQRTTGRSTVCLSLFLFVLVEQWQVKLNNEDKHIIYRGLLIQPPQTDIKFQEIVEINNHFPSRMKEKRRFASKLFTFVNNDDGEDINPSWLYCIPLLHILNEDTTVFCQPGPSSHHDTAKWWGVDNCGNKTDNFKKATLSSRWEVPEETVLKDLQYAIQADPLMLRTFFSTLNLDNLLRLLTTSEVPLNITMGSLCYYAKTQVNSFQRKTQALELILNNAAFRVQEQLKSSGNPTRLEVENAMSDTAIAVDLLHEVVTNIKRHEITVLTVILVLAHLDLYTRGYQHLHAGKNFPKIFVPIHDNAIHYIGEWLKSTQLNPNEQIFTFRMCDVCIFHCSCIANESIRVNMESVFISELLEKISKIPHDLRVTACFNLMDFQMLSSVINIYQYLEEDISVIFKDNFWDNFDNQRRSAICNQLSRLLEDRLHSKVHTQEDMMRFVFTWKPLTVFMNLLSQDVFVKNLTSIAEREIVRAFNFVKELLLRLSNAEIKVWEVLWLANNNVSFLIVVETIFMDKYWWSHYTLQLRQKEIATYQLVVQELNRLHKFCRKLLVTDDADEVIRCSTDENKDINEQMIRDLLNALPEQNNPTVEEYQPSIKLIGVPEQVNHFLPVVWRHLNSALFCQIMEIRARSMHIARDVKWWHVIISLWRESTNEFSTSCNNIKNGNITLEEIRDLFSFLDEDAMWLDKCHNELQKIASPEDTGWVEERIHQMKCLSDVTRLRDVANVISALRLDYGFSGAVNDIETFLEVDMKQKLKHLQSSVLATSSALSKITGEQVEHLKQFGSDRCTPFVEWVRDTMSGDGLQEVKVFVDLALNYVGDNPMDMDKVRNLQAVITGYAPLIFQTCTGTITFLERCHRVCQNITADPNLPQKLEETVRSLKWFDDIHKFHGSVEKTALAQVESISQRGILMLCREELPKREGVHDVTLEKVIYLKVPDDSESQSIKVYTYQDLVDLQSRLMLVVGHEERNDENIDRFVSVMDSVERLAKLYVQLCRDGCLLLLNWNVKFFCNQTLTVCCISEFFRGKIACQRFKGLRESNSLEDYIAKVATFLENCGSQWLNYVSETRHKYVELNMYTMEQLVFLQEQLVLKESDSMYPHIFPLLSLLRPNCQSHHIQQAMAEASAEAATGAEVNEKMDSPESRETLTIANFIKYMQENGLSKELATKALKNGVEPNDLDQGLQWCVEHSEEEEVEEENAIFETEAGTRGGMLQSLISRNETIAMALKLLDQQGTDGKLSLEALFAKLGDIWKKFLDTVKYSGEDCLSLEHLGLILKHLAKQNTQDFNRCMPPGFKPGCPHLVLCSRHEVLKVITSLYMFTRNAPLPHPDEVLLCTQDTSFEKVDMFLIRALSKSAHDKGKLHCLAFADHLDYDVSEKTVKRLTEYVNTTNYKYQLVMICTKENEMKAHISAALEKYLIPTPTPVKSKDVLAYLQTKFTVCEDLPSQNTAACVDPKRLCVRVVKSTRSGMGKTLYKNRLVARLKDVLDKDDSLSEGGEETQDFDGESKVEEEKPECSITIPLYEKTVDARDVATRLMPYVQLPDIHSPKIIHLDISYEVLEGVDVLLYSLLVLGCISDHQGHVWLRSDTDLYLVEAMPLLEHSDEKIAVHQMYDILPSVSCLSPSESLEVLKRFREKNDGDQLFDGEEFESAVFQRPIHYLRTLQSFGRRHFPQPFIPTNERKTNKTKEISLQLLIRHCGVVNPSWAELHHFMSFLNQQLEDFENSAFCSQATSNDLPGFASFVLRFIIHMSRDFATRSLEITETPIPALAQEVKHDDKDDDDDDDDDNDLKRFRMRREWESSPHPYIFFNPDHHSMTFLGFTIDQESGSLLDQSGRVLESNIMNEELFNGLIHNEVPLDENFDVLPRHEKLQKMYQVMGLTLEEMTDEMNEIVDPDKTYELTTDNVKKILAIYMRFRCNIPVVIMGETGCGKTRLVKFLCALQSPKNARINTMVLMKVHGGTTSQDIHKKVKEAEKLAKKIKKAFINRPVYTVLFFDEANTTEAIGAIKEVMCDGTLNGKPIQLHENLKMVAACNPYRKHSKEMIQHLEKAGLGYHVSADKTSDKLGRLPMRHLVYRVQPLPQSMLSLVWDFGQLSSDAEFMYIWHMVLRCEWNGQLWLSDSQRETLCHVLVASQEFMRSKKDECSFVSLRDAERALTVYSWFLQHPEILLRINSEERNWRITDITKALVLALGICYRAGLRNKEEYENAIVPLFASDFHLEDKPLLFRHILERCAIVLLDNMKPVEKIARNQALKENVFMMVVCVELRIPLFLVGKPGSSKSLAKTVVADAMRGPQSYGEVFRYLKEAQIVSFQCSPLSTAEGILATFRQCAHIQQGKDKDKFVSVAVLDEVGLAEDSPKMPLKALHPLLEEGCDIQELLDENEEDELGTVESESESDQESLAEELTRDTHEKVAFIGISNWALDPAKMNRGLLVQREVPDVEELVQTAEGICTGVNGVLEFVKNLLQKLANAYLSIFNEANNKREFFGLRDFYSMVKMVHAFATKHQRKLTRSEFRTAILRNFGGLELDSLDPVKIFEQELCVSDLDDGNSDESNNYSPLQMALHGDNLGGEGRYLLLLTESSAGLRTLTNILKDDNVIHIFGSSFPRDQGYTQICSNINRIKVCMETGKTVILLNLDNLYESLYDALNQSYSILAGVRYVDLGLGSHRVKCKVDKQFRLIVVAEKHTVYEKFPIPLINRLEKHFLTVSNILDDFQLKLESELRQWVDNVVALSSAESVGDVFVGFHEDTTASIILVNSENASAENERENRREKFIKRCQSSLLWSATPDAVIRSQNLELFRLYFEEQQHDNLAQYLNTRLELMAGSCLLAQVTTHSKMLTEHERGDLEIQMKEYKFTLLSLQAFQTEQQFTRQLSVFLGGSDNQKKVLIVQCECGNLNQTLLQCAQYCVQSVWPCQSTGHHVVFIVQLPREATRAFKGYQGGRWHCAHIDELRSPSMTLPDLSQLQSKSPAQLFSYALPRRTDVSYQTELAQDNLPFRSPGSDKGLVQYLMCTSVQMAMACIRDNDEDSDRSMHRIHILLQCLENTNNDTFFHAIWRLMLSVLEEIEAANPEAKLWLIQDAARLDWIKKSGTFRRAWIQSLQKYLVPVMAGVVAFLDTNHNLDFMESQPDAAPWLQQLWLDILDDPSLCVIKYSDLLTMSTRPDRLTDLVCRSTFMAESPTSAALPFSWIMAELVDISLISTSSQQQDGVDLTESEMIRHLQSVITSEEMASDFLHRYIADLLCARFRLDPQHHQLMMQCFMGALRQDGMSFKPCDIGVSLLQIHRVLVQVRPRLRAVLDMVACHPRAVQALQEKRLVDQSSQNGDDEMVEDVLLLSMLVEELCPKKDQLNTDDGCRAWLDLFNTIAPIISRVIADVDANLEPDCGRSYVGGVGRRNYFPYGQICRMQLDNIRCQWTQAATLKLFIDYMNPLVRDSGQTNLTSKRVNYTLLWNLLSKKANLKTKETLLNVDKFLKHANGQMVRGLLGNIGNCKHCETKLEGPPIVLPCAHMICNRCYTQDAKISKTCPECKSSFSETFDPLNTDLPNRDAVNQLLRYQRQSSSFLMALVSQFCFSGRAPPEPDAVEHICGYVIRREKGTSTIHTRQLTLCDDQIDPSPVLRSFLLRLLLQYSENEVSLLITKFLEEAKSLIQQQVDMGTVATSMLIELSLLVVHCIENLQHEKEAIDEKRNGEEVNAAKCKNQCSYIADLLHEVRQVLDSSPLELSTLISLGRLRYALDSCARILYACVIEPSRHTTLNADIKDLMRVAASVCDRETTDWPKKFLIKLLCREYGVGAYNTIIQRSKEEKCLQWIQLDNARKVEDVPDRYLLCGEDYLSLRTEIMQIMRGNQGQLEQKLQSMSCTSRKKKYLIMLALHREVTMSCINSSASVQADLQRRARELVQSEGLGIDKVLAHRVCTNSLGKPGSPMCVHAEQSLGDQSLVCVLTHFWMALRGSSILDIALPFTTIINQPAHMLNSYLPSMPQDSVEEIAQALAIGPNNVFDQNLNPEAPKLWECPFGHRYVIGDCGNPNEQSKCPECGVVIGARDYHVAAFGNREVSAEDRTTPGHTLGPVANRSKDAVPERNMSATVCAVLRFLTHSSLFLSASQPQQTSIVTQMVNPPISEDEVVAFFWEHLQHDIQVLCRALHKCCDDVYLLLHSVCDRLFERQTEKFYRCPLSKKQRENWETKFCEEAILPVLQQADIIIQDGNRMIVSDTRQGQNHLLNLIYEVGEDDELDSETELQHTAVPWKYRTRITVDHFFNNFQLHVQETRGVGNSYPVLKLFHDESTILRALHYLPDILENQHRLIQQLCHKMNRDEATNTTIREMLQKKECAYLQELLTVFSKAWEMIKTQLISYRCQTEDKTTLQLPPEFHNLTISGSSPLAIMLPDTLGPGLCSYMLISFLLVRHNHFLELYCPLVQQRFDRLPEITVEAVTKRHLLGYSPQSDLLPLVLAHCNYSLHLGHTGSDATQLDYDFQGFELQLRSTLLLGKSRIQRQENGSFKIKTMDYLADTASCSLFKRLRKKIPQISLSPRVRREIAQDLRGNVPDICQSIDNINTALVYLLSLRTDAEKNLSQFMTDTLKMRDTIHSRKAQNYCCLKHVQSLWLLLCMERATTLATQNQEAFDGQGVDLRDDLQDNQKTTLEDALKRLKPERLDQLLWQLFEGIMLHLVQQVGEDFALPGNYSVYWLISEYLVDSPLYDESPEEAKETLLTKDDLKDFPQSLTASQAIPTWLAVHRHLTVRVQQAV